MSQKWLTTAEAARYLGISRVAMWKKCCAGRVNGARRVLKGNGLRWGWRIPFSSLGTGLKVRGKRGRP